MKGRFLVGVTTVAVIASYIVVLLAAVAPSPVLFLVFAAIVVLLELWLSRRTAELPTLVPPQLSARFRLLSLDVLTAVLVARFVPSRHLVVLLAIAAVLLLHAGRDAAGIFARRREWRRNGGPVSWRGLTVRALPEPRSPRPVGDLSVPLSLLTLIPAIGAAAGDLTDRTTVIVVAESITIAVVVLLLLGRLIQYAVLNRVGRDQVRAAVRDAIEAAAPEVVLHFSGRRGTVEQVQLWVPALRSLPERVLLLVREATHLDALAGCGLPVVWAPRSQDVELFMVPSISLALYPSDATNINNHLIRVPGILDVLIGHGDSDEPENRSPIARMYDEVWVAGPAGRARYAWAASGVPDERIREIGPIRPAVDAAVPEPLSTRPVVLYAPTWEGVADSMDLSSVLEHGGAVLDALLARQDVRVLFAPAAATGSRLQPYRDAVLALSQRVAAAGLDHLTIEPGMLPDALRQASFAVVDVSPALLESARFDVPYAVCALGGRSVDAMRAMFPTTLGGTIVANLPHDVLGALDDALGPDSTAPARARVAAASDGGRGDVAESFAGAVAEARAVQARRRAFARPGVTP